MAKQKTIIIAALNITIHPHSADLYIDLMQSAFDLRRSVGFYGDNKAIIGTFSRTNDPVFGCYGQIYKYLDIDPEAQWFDLESGEAADDDDMIEVKIPEKLRPNMVTAHYFLCAEKHALYFECKNKDGKSFSPKLVKKFFECLFSDSRVIEEFGEVGVTVYPDQDALEAVLGLSVLESLEMNITRPNPDDLELAEREVFERMAGMGVKSMKQEVKSIKDGTIKLDQEMRKLVEIASKNGYAKSKGKTNDGQATEMSTVDHPKQWLLKFDFLRGSPLSVIKNFLSSFRGSP